MNNLEKKLQEFLVSVLVSALKDFDANLEVDTSLVVTTSEIPLVNLPAKESPMSFLIKPDHKELVVFTDDQLTCYVNTVGDDEGLGFLLQNTKVSIHKDGNEIKVYVGNDNGCQIIASNEQFTNAGIDLNKLFISIEELIKTDCPEFHSHRDINAVL